MVIAMSEKGSRSEGRDAKTKENKSHGSNAFPMAAYHASFRPNPAFNDDAAFYFFNAHWHEEFELFYLPRGNCVFCMDGKCYPLREGDAILVPPNVIHWAYKLGCRMESEYSALVFSPALFGGYLSDDVYAKYVLPVLDGAIWIAPVFSHDIPWQSEVIKRLLAILALYHGAPCRDSSRDVLYSELFLDKDANGAELKIKSLIFDLWYLCMQHAEKRSIKKRKSRTHQEQINQAIAYIHAHYNEKFTLDELAASVYMSKDYFSHIFKEYTQSQPFTYLNGYRIRKSVELLDNTDKKIIEIANLCGFEHVSYFNRKFAEFMKCTPSEYRRNKRASE